MAAWLAGVGLMFLRMVAMVIGGGPIAEVSVGRSRMAKRSHLVEQLRD